MGEKFGKGSNLVSKEEAEYARYLKENFYDAVNNNSPKVNPRTSFYTKYGKRMLDLIISIPVFLLLLPLACLPLTVRTLRMAAHVYRDNPQCPKWRGLERASGGIHFLFGMLYAVSLCLWQIAMFKR